MESYDGFMCSTQMNEDQPSDVPMRMWPKLHSVPPAATLDTLTRERADSGLSPPDALRTLGCPVCSDVSSAFSRFPRRTETGARLLKTETKLHQSVL